MSKKKSTRDELEKLPEEIAGEKKEKTPLELDIEAFKKNYGIDVEPVKNQKYKLNKIRAWLGDKYEFRYNLFAKKPEWKKKDEKDFEFFEERDFDNLYNRLEMDEGISIGTARLSSFIGSDKVSKDFDAIAEYIFALPKWDEKDRFPYFLTQIKLQRETEAERNFLIKYFTKWFVTMVGSLIDKDVVNEVAPVFSGDEGRGKTRFFLSLVPKDLRLKYTYVGNFDPHDKDDKEKLGTMILIFLDEMKTINRTDIESIKEAMSKRSVTLRRAYGRGNIHLYRRASFCGATNDDKFLTDTGPNRRWLAFAIDNIDIYDDFNIDLLYAQALHVFREWNITRAVKENGFSLWYDTSEIDAFRNRNDQYRRLAPEEELIMLHWQKPTKDELERKAGYLQYLTATDVMYKISSMNDYKKMNANDTKARQIGRILTSLGFPVHRGRIPGYNTPRDCYIMIPREFDTVNKIMQGKDVTDNDSPQEAAM